MLLFIITEVYNNCTKVQTHELSGRSDRLYLKLVFLISVNFLIQQILNNTYLKAHVKCCAGIYILEVTIFLSWINVDLIVHGNSR